MAVRRLAGAGAVAAAVVAASLDRRGRLGRRRHRAPPAGPPPRSTASPARWPSAAAPPAWPTAPARRSRSSFPTTRRRPTDELPDLATMAAGSVTIETVFHVITDDAPTPAERARLEQMIADQMQVLNDSYTGGTSADAADTPFRFDLVDTTWTVSPQWHTVTPGKAERDMKKALHVGDSETLNVYAADIGGGLLGWAYFPKDYNNGRDYIDGVVILDESMPGGVTPTTRRAPGPTARATPSPTRSATGCCSTTPSPAAAAPPATGSPTPRRRPTRSSAARTTTRTPARRPAWTPSTTSWTTPTTPAWTCSRRARPTG